MRGSGDWHTEREPLEETAFHRISTDSEEGSLSDVAWAVYFSLLAILVIANPAEWPAGSILSIIGLSAVVAVCRRRRIGLSLRALRARIRRPALDRGLGEEIEGQLSESGRGQDLPEPGQVHESTALSEVPSVLGAAERERASGPRRRRHTTT